VPIFKGGTDSLLHNAKNVAIIDELVKHFSTAALLANRSPERDTVLHSAVMLRRPVQVICKLLKLGADPLAVKVTGQTPADLARASGQTLIAQLLDRAAQDTQNKRATTA
jgi:ankyrin repeat protein